MNDGSWGPAPEVDLWPLFFYRRVPKNVAICLYMHTHACVGMHKRTRTDTHISPDKLIQKQRQKRSCTSMPTLKGVSLYKLSEQSKAKQRKWTAQLQKDPRVSSPAKKNPVSYLSCPNYEPQVVCITPLTAFHPYFVCSSQVFVSVPVTES